MKTIVKSGEEDADASSSFSHLPDEIILLILNKLIDLKTLCFCYLVSRRFSSIVLQVDAIYFTAPLINPRSPDKNTVGDVAPIRPLPSTISLSGKFSALFSRKLKGVGDASPPTITLFGESFISAFTFLSKFKAVKSLRIELLSSSEVCIDNRRLFRWMVKFGNRIQSFIFLSPNSIIDMDGFCVSGNGDNEVISNMVTGKFEISLQCLKDAIAWHMMLLYSVKNLPMLEKVSITDTGRRGRLSLSGEKLSEVKKWARSASETVINRVEAPNNVHNGYIPVLKLPVSGYVMKDIYFGVMEMKDLRCGYDGLMNSEDGFEDKEEAAYTEAMMEILEREGHDGAVV